MFQADENLTRKVADLARLELSDAEVRTFTPQLAEILKYIDELESVPVDGIEPLTHPVEMATPFREDEVRPFPVDSQGHSKVIATAPELEDGGFKVPPVL